MKIEIERSGQMSGNRYFQNVFVDEEFIGSFRPWYGEYHFHDKAGVTVSWKTGDFMANRKFISVDRISEMVQVVADNFSRIPTSDGIKKREASDHAKKRCTCYRTGRI